MEEVLDYHLEYKKYIASFESFLSDYINNLNDVDDVLLKSMKYSLFSGGKRVRPVIMLAMYDLCLKNYNNKKGSHLIYKFASAIEMIHTYSLIHDDLPCMDNDTLRREQPCNHIVFGESTALLAGDALLDLAFEIVSSVDDDVFDCQAVLRCINILSELSGCRGMVSGQCLDLKWDKSLKTKETLIDIYNLKTAKLIIAASKIGAILGGANEEKIKLAEDFGKNIGICFQLVDDILDNEKENIALFEEPDATHLVKSLIEDSYKKLNLINNDCDFLKEFTLRLMTRLK